MVQIKTPICRLKFDIYFCIFCLKVQQTLHYPKIKDLWQLFYGSGFKGLKSFFSTVLDAWVQWHSFFVFVHVSLIKTAQKWKIFHLKVSLGNDQWFEALCAHKWRHWCKEMFPVHTGVLMLTLLPVIPEPSSSLNNSVWWKCWSWEPLFTCSPPIIVTL